MILCIISYSFDKHQTKIVNTAKTLSKAARHYAPLREFFQKNGTRREILRILIQLDSIMKLLYNTVKNERSGDFFMNTSLFYAYYYLFTGLAR